MKHRQTLLFLSFIVLAGCTKVKYYPDRPVTFDRTRFIAHRAGGHGDYRENTLEAAIGGFSVLDGIETDIQISRDTTIWMSHSETPEPCDNPDGKCFEALTDDQISQIDTCLGPGEQYSRLNDVFRYMEQHHDTSYISLDVKAWKPCDLSFPNTLQSLNKLGDEIIRLVKTHHLQNHVMVESETASFLRHIKRNSTGIICYLTTFGDFDRGMGIALEYGLDGLSFEYKFKDDITAGEVNLLHKKGLRIQVWTVDEPQYLKEAFSIGVDFIQTDELNAPEVVKE